MNITRTITKEGLKTNGGAIIPSPFEFNGTVSGIDAVNHTVGWGGGFKVPGEEQLLTIQGTNPHPRFGVVSTVGAKAEGCCSCSEDGLVHTINETALIEAIDAFIAKRLGIEASDIS